MRALTREVMDAVFETIESMLPDTPSGRRGRPRIPDRVIFRAIMLRLVNGGSWQTTERTMDYVVSDTTMRSRRDEWIRLGIFDRLVNQALMAFDRIIGLDLSHVSVDGSLHKAPCGGEGTGPNPCDRGKRGWKWSVMTEAHGIPLGYAIDGANRQDMVMLDATLHHVDRMILVRDIGALHLDRGYDNQMVRAVCTKHGLTDLHIAPKRKTRSKSKKKTPAPKQPVGPRWKVERTNSWFSNYGQLRRNTDRTPEHRLAQLHLVTTLLITIKLLDWRDRWSNIR
jgi:transposase